MDATAAIALVLGGVLLPALGFLIRTSYSRLDRDINSLGSKLNEHQLAVAEKYVSRESLREALAPLSESLRDLREGQERIFHKLDGKADKHGASD